MEREEETKWKPKYKSFKKKLEGKKNKKVMEEKIGQEKRKRGLKNKPKTNMKLFTEAINTNIEKKERKSAY